MALIKEKIENKCHDCGEEAIAVLVAKTQGVKQSGIMWRCKNDHLNRTRDYKLHQVKVG